MQLRSFSLPLASLITVSLALAAFQVQAQTPAQQAWQSSSGQIKVLSFEQLERIAAREVAYISEIEVRDLLLKVKGHDAQGMKIELLMDRRDGQVMERKLKYPKHLRGGYVPAGAAVPGQVIPHR